MFRLLKCEFKKFKNTYINSLSFLGMISPVILVFVMFVFKKKDFIQWGSYNWDNFNDQLSMFFIFLVGPILTSFIAVFSVFYEYQQKSMKDVLSSPHGRIKIALAKIVYVCAFVLLQYIVVAVIDILCAFVLGFDLTLKSAADGSLNILLSGLSTLILVPLMVFLTMLFKGFIPGMVIAVAGTISNILILNWEKSYLSPWSVPADMSMILSQRIEMDIMNPIISAGAYFLLFMLAALIYFKHSDQNT